MKSFPNSGLRSSSRISTPSSAIAERCYIMEKGTITRALAGDDVNADNVRAQLLL